MSKKRSDPVSDPNWQDIDQLKYVKKNCMKSINPTIQIVMEPINRTLYCTGQEKIYQTIFKNLTVGATDQLKGLATNDHLIFKT